MAIINSLNSCHHSLDVVDTAVGVGSGDRGLGDQSLLSGCPRSCLSLEGVCWEGDSVLRTGQDVRRAEIGIEREVGPVGYLL